MRKLKQRILAVLLAVSMVAVSAPAVPAPAVAEAATQDVVTLNTTSLTNWTVGKTGNFYAYVNGKRVANSTLTWSSSNTAVATCENGVLTAVGAGTATITCTKENAVAATCTVTVKGNDVVTLNATSLTNWAVGKTGSFYAYVNGKRVNNATMTWSSSNPAVATCENGVLTAVGAGTAVISCTKAGATTATCTVTVKGNDVVTLNATSLTNWTVGKTGSFYAYVNGKRVANNTMTWSSSNTAVATCENGVLTAVGAGTAVISCTKAGATTATCTVTVKGDDVVTLNATSLTNWAVGKTGSFYAYVNGKRVANNTLTWSSSNTAVATCENGVLTAVGPGTAIISCTKAGATTATCTVTVKGEDVVTLNVTSLTNWKVGKSGNFYAYVNGKRVANNTLTWSSSDPSVATCENGVLTAVGAGTAVISCTRANATTATCTVTVVASTDTRVSFEGHYYQFIPVNGRTWAEIKEYCESVGGYPASILSADENEFLYQAMVEKGYNVAYFGYTDEESEGNWKWVTGEESEYTNWYLPELDNFNNEDYAMLWTAIEAGTWNDGGLREDEAVFICEWGEYEIVQKLPYDADYLFNDHYYKFIPADGRSWNELKEWCESQGGYLATVSSVEENDFLYDKMLEKGYKNAFFGYYRTEDNQWKWANREIKVYENWHPGEPNDENGTEDYAMFYSEKFTDKTWNDGENGDYSRTAYICEWGEFEREAIEEEIELLPSDFTYGDKEGYYVCTGLSESGYEKFEKYLSKDTVIIRFPDISDTGDEVEGFYSDSTYDLGTLEKTTEPYMKLIFPDTYLVYYGETGTAPERVLSVEFSDGLEYIAKKAFYGYKGLTGIVLPDSIEEYGDQAFEGCTNLVIDVLYTDDTKMGSKVFNGVTISNVVISETFAPMGPGAGNPTPGTFVGATINGISYENGCEKIPEDAFRGCTGLTKVVIPEGIVTIGSRAFRDCSKLVNVTLPNTLEMVDKQAFKDCVYLRKMTLPDTVEELAAEVFKGCTRLEIETFNTAGKKVWGDVFYGVTIEEVIVEETFYAVDPRAGWTNNGPFRGTVIETISFADGIEKIPDDTFRDCASIESIEIPDTVTEIGLRAFYNCDALTDVVLPEGLEVINKQAFAYCDQLENIELVEATYTYGAEAFYKCNKIKIETLDTRNKALSGSVFYGVTIDEVIVGDTFEWFDAGDLANYGTFDGAILNVITFEEGITQIPSHVFKNCNSIEEITIPDGVVSIGEKAFRACKGLKTVVLPDTLREIGKEAFRDCTELTNINVSIGTTIGADAFKNCSSLEAIPQ